MAERLVAVAYPTDGEIEEANRTAIGEAARVSFLGQLPEAEREASVEEAEVLLAWATSREIRRRSLGGSKNLKFVQLLSAGVDHVDLDAIPPSALVASNVGAYSDPMAEHVVAMTLALAKHLPERHAAMARGQWDQQLTSSTLDGAVVGIVGYGGIGRATARLVRPFGARIWAVNTSGATGEEVEHVGTLADLDHLLSGSDVVVLAIPLTRATRGLIGATQLASMKPGAILINVARGAVVDQQALYEHLRAHPEFSAGIDTWWDEPSRNDEFRPEFPFLDLPNVIGSPHNSSLVPGILTVAARHAAENVARYLRGKPVSGLVSREDY